MTDFILYHTSACHLCELAEDILLPVMQQHQQVMQRVDIADDDILLDTYGVRIPVLRHLASGNELGWPFAQTQALEFVRMTTGQNGNNGNAA